MNLLPMLIVAGSVGAIFFVIDLAAWIARGRRNAAPAGKHTVKEDAMEATSTSSAGGAR